MRQPLVPWAALPVVFGLLLALPLPTSDAQAQDFSRALGGVGKLFKKAVRPPNFGGGSGSGKSGSKRDSGDGDSSDSSSDSSSEKQESSRAEAAKALKVLYLRQVEIEEQNRARELERARNVDLAVREFIDELRRQHAVLRNERRIDVSVAQGTNINEVTEGTVKSAIEAAFDKAGLNAFARMAGEMWTRDRLLVRIVDRAKFQLEPYFTGVGARGPSMENLKEEVFPKSARYVYATALEMSEIIGVSHSFDRFMRTVYENSDSDDDRFVTSGSESKYEQYVTAAINAVPLKKFVRDGGAVAADPLGLERNFQFRFRARRALYDCLSSNYAQFYRGSRRPTGGGQTVEAAYSGSSAPTAPSSRGVQIETGQLSAPTAAAKTPAPSASATAAASAPATPVASLEQSKLDWDQAQTRLASACGGRIAAIASARIQPVPARWTSTGDNSGTGAAKGDVQPAMEKEDTQSEEDAEQQ